MWNSICMCMYCFTCPVRYLVTLIYLSYWYCKVNENAYKICKKPIEMLDTGMSTENVAMHVWSSSWSIRNLHARFQMTWPTNDSSRHGRSPVTTCGEDCYIMNKHSRNRFQLTLLLLLACLGFIIHEWNNNPQAEQKSIL